LVAGPADEQIAFLELVGENKGLQELLTIHSRPTTSSSYFRRDRRGLFSFLTTPRKVSAKRTQPRAGSTGAALRSSSLRAVRAPA
jgi:hypothetical protein